MTPLDAAANLAAILRQRPSRLGLQDQRYWDFDARAEAALRAWDAATARGSEGAEPPAS